jgi:small subunit ribosomal protein S13
MNIFGKYFDDNDQVLKSLTKIYGIGQITAKELIMTFGIGLNTKVKELSKEMWSRIIQSIEVGPQKYNNFTRFTRIYQAQNFSTKDLIGNNNSNLKSSASLNKPNTINKKLHQLVCENRALAIIHENIDRSKKIKSYKGLRHLEGLPCRGQRTHTNAITARKKRK